MKKLSSNSTQVLAYLKSNKATQFSATQVGVAVGKKLPKNAAAWSKPILEELVAEDLVVVEQNGAKTVYQFNANAKPVISQDDIDNAVSAEEIALKLAEHISAKQGGKIEEAASKKDKKAVIEKALPAAIKEYDKHEAEKIPAQYSDSLLKLVSAILLKSEPKVKKPRVKAEKAPKEPKVKEPTIYQTVDMTGLTKDVKAEVKALGEDASTTDINKKVREVVMNTLKDTYKFNETNLKDKRTKAILHKVRVAMGLSEQHDDNTDVVFEPGAKVKFMPHVSSNLGYNKATGTVVTTFTNDFGARFVVIKSGEKRVTKRDKDVTLA